MIIFSNLNSEKLTFDQAVVNPPFKIASTGSATLLPKTDAMLIRGRGVNWKQWYKVTLVDNDTTLFIDSNDFKWNNRNLFINSLKFSEDEKKILLKTEVEKIWRHSNKATYFVYDIEKELMIPISQNNKNLRNVKFSPDGTKVAYVRNDNNLYLYDLKKNRERKLTSSGSSTVLNGHFGWLYEEELTGYDGYRWSPNGESIAYWEENNSMVKEYSLIDDSSLYPSIKKIRYPKAGESNPELRIGVIRINGYGRKWIDIAKTQNDYLPWMEWVNSEKIAFLKMDRKQQNWEMFVSDKVSGKSLKILSESDENGWLDNHGQIRFLNDGKIIWVSEKSGYKHIWIAKHSGSSRWPVTKGNWEVSKIIHVNEAKQKIYFTANKESVFENRFYSIGFDGSDLKLLTVEEGHHRVQLTGSKSHFIDTYSSLRKPKIITLKNIESGELIRSINATELEQFLDYEWSFPEIISFPSSDKTTKLDGCIIFPPDYSPGKKYPVIVHGYGMPGTQIVWNRWSSLFDQFLAQQGYIVFSMDSRGMSGRGEKFKNLSYGNMSKYLAEDHLTGINRLIELGYADPNRIGAWGWSGGGYFTCLMLTKNGKYFKAGVAVAPCTDFRLYDSAYTERSMGLPDENKNGYDSTSVLSWIDSMEGSLLLMHGVADDNVHVQHSNRFVQEAIKAKKNIEWYYYPERNHGIYGSGAREHLYKKLLEFFKENLKNAYGKSK